MRTRIEGRINPIATLDMIQNYLMESSFVSGEKIRKLMGFLNVSEEGKRTDKEPGSVNEHR